MIAMERVVIPIGTRFGLWTVIGAGTMRRKWVRYLLVRCECGIEREVYRGDLRGGKSSGCRRCTHDDGRDGLHVLFDHVRGEAGKRGLSWTLSEPTFRALVTANCFYCDAPPDGRKIDRGDRRSRRTTVPALGIDRMDSAVGYEDGNCVPCCRRCNFAKGRLLPHEYVEHCRRVAAHRLPVRVLRRQERADDRQLPLSA